MYRIELAPGDETALRTIDELAIGIRNGVITSRARIWHNAGQKWLPIEFHPHYQAALKQIEAESEPAVDQSKAKAPADASAIDEPAAEALPTPAAAVLAADRPRPALRPIGLLAGGVALIAIAQMVTSAPAAGDEPDNVAHAVAANRRSSSSVSESADTTAAATTMPAPAPASSDSTPMATLAGVASRSAAGGGVVRGPSAEMPSFPESVASEPVVDDSILIAPAPVITDLPLAPPPENP
jgi:hypothetical protein